LESCRVPAPTATFKDIEDPVLDTGCVRVMENEDPWEGPQTLPLDQEKQFVLHRGHFRTTRPDHSDGSIVMCIQQSPEFGEQVNLLAGKVHFLFHDDAWPRQNVAHQAPQLHGRHAESSEPSPEPRTQQENGSLGCIGDRAGQWVAR
jgi:hypothetical protein